MRTAGAQRPDDSSLPSYNRPENFVSASIVFSPSRTSQAGETPINGDGFHMYHIGESPRALERKSSRSDRWEYGAKWRSMLKPVDESTSRY